MALQFNFEAVQIAYPYTKRTLRTEFTYFQNTHAEHAIEVHKQLPDLEHLLANNKQRRELGQFMSQNANLQRWIYNRK